MKHSFEIYKHNMSAIFTNWAALIVVVALGILPSLYAWFNIKASWDPYGKESTSGIKVGVVNQDEGTVLSDQEINIGDEIIAELKKNEQLGWQFVDEETALKEIESGTYYAMITIPSNFSSNLTSIVSSEIKKGEIIYTVNEKINAIAPKLTDKGVTSLQSMISKTVVETVSEVIFNIANEIGVNLEGEIPNIEKAQGKLVEIQGKFGDVESFLGNTEDSVVKLKKLLAEVNDELPKIKETIINSEKFASSVKSFLESSKTTAEEIGPVIRQDILVAQAIVVEVTNSAQALKEALEGNLETAPAMLAQLQAKVESLNRVTKSLLTILESLNNLSTKQPFDAIIAQLSSARTKLDSVKQLLNTIEMQINAGQEIDFPTLTKIITLGNSINEIITKVVGEYDTTIAPQLTNIFEQANTALDGVIGVLDAAKEKLPDVKALISVATKSADQGKEGLAYAKTILPKGEALVNDLVEKLKEVSEDNNLQNLVELLKSDVTSRSDFLATPVDITENHLYPIANYGTGMTPFYTVLSLWVGALLLVSMLSVEAHGEYKAYQVYLGKLALFYTISIVQALIVSLGDLYLLKITCKNPILFLIGNVFAAVTFTSLVYSLVSVFGNVGKVISIILLVLQVAGSGGTFPIQLTPKFFQKLNPFLPFTYAISFDREAIGGVVKEVLMKDSIILLLYIGVALIISLLLKEPINRILRRFTERFKESGIGEH